MKKKFNKGNVKRFSKVFGPLLIMMFAFSLPTYAAGTPKIMSGTTSLVQTSLNWVMALIPTAAAFALGWCKVQKMISGNDPAVVAKQNTWMKNIIISAVIGETASALITSIVAFYK